MYTVLGKEEGWGFEASSKEKCKITVLNAWNVIFIFNGKYPLQVEHI